MDTTRSTRIKKTVESVALPILAVVLLRLWPGGHFGYPWWWLAPLAIALRYGVSFGVGSGLVLVVGNLVAGHYAAASWPLPGSEIVGGFIATYLAGLYAGHSRNRLTEANARLEYLEQRLESLTRVFYVTRLSHSRLEENLITKADDLRSALVAIAEQIGDDFSESEPLPERPLQNLLQLLAFYGRLGNTGIYAVVDGDPQSHPAAHLGAPFRLDTDDVLVRGVIEEELPAYYSVDQILADRTSAYRVVLPLIAADGTLLALIVVADLPLLALDEENLLTVAAMAAYVADALHGERLSHRVRRAVPACPSEFALDWARLGHLRRHAQVRSSWVLLTPGEQARGEVVELISGARRGLDRYWLQIDGEQAASRLMVVLPLAGEGAVEGFIQRIDAMCSEHFGASLQVLGWHASLGSIEHGSGDELRRVLEQETTDAH